MKTKILLILSLMFFVSGQMFASSTNSQVTDEYMMLSGENVKNAEQNDLASVNSTDTYTVKKKRRSVETYDTSGSWSVSVTNTGSSSFSVNIDSTCGSNFSDTVAPGQTKTFSGYCNGSITITIYTGSTTVYAYATVVVVH